MHLMLGNGIMANTIEIEFTDKWTNEMVLELVGELFNKDEDMNNGDMEV